MAVRYVLVVLVLLCLCAPVWAQDSPRSELFGGFSYHRNSEINFSGWQAAYAMKADSRWSVVGDFGGQYMGGIKLYEYMGGVRAGMHRGTLTTFAHILAGGQSASGSGKSVSGFALSPGGGLDIKVGKRYSIRAVQVDFIDVRSSGSWSGAELRLGFGLVIPLGK